MPNKFKLYIYSKLKILLLLFCFSAIFMNSAQAMYVAFGPKVGSMQYVDVTHINSEKTQKSLLKSAKRNSKAQWHLTAMMGKGMYYGGFVSIENKYQSFSYGLHLELLYSEFVATSLYVGKIADYIDGTWKPPTKSKKKPSPLDKLPGMKKIKEFNQLRKSAELTQYNYKVITIPILFKLSLPSVLLRYSSSLVPFVIAPVVGLCWPFWDVFRFLLPSTRIYIGPRIHFIKKATKKDVKKSMNERIEMLGKKDIKQKFSESEKIPKKDMIAFSADIYMKLGFIAMNIFGFEPVMGIAGAFRVYPLFPKNQKILPYSKDNDAKHIISGNYHIEGFLDISYNALYAVPSFRSNKLKRSKVKMLP